MLKTTPIKRLAIYISSLLLLILAGCTTTGSMIWQQVSIAQGVSLSLTPPPQALVGKSFNQILTIKTPSRQDVLVSQLAFTKNGLVLVAMTVQGIPVFQLEYQYQQPLKTKSYVLLPGFDPIYILADIQLTHWPVDTLMANLDGATLKFEPKTGRRQIMVANEAVINIEASANTYQLNHLQRDYQLTITKA
ncbi:MAG: DUF3261 domain-containing protein [Gammaproteobacteria bacterium]|nr:DUF3261 domain-containing protein [Gammaproteobacteria bacterium]